MSGAPKTHRRGPMMGMLGIVAGLFAGPGGVEHVRVIERRDAHSGSKLPPIVLRSTVRSFGPRRGHAKRSGLHATHKHRRRHARRRPRSERYR